MSANPPSDQGGGGQSTNEGGRGGGRFRRGGNRGGGGRGQTNRPTATNTSTFKGDTAEMNGHIFECHGERASRPQYKKTIEHLHAYVKKNLRYPEDLAPLFMDIMGPVAVKEPDRPVAVEGVIDQLTLMDYKAARDRYEKHHEKLAGNLAALFAVIWGQCTEAMKSKVKSLDGWSTAQSENDCYWLLQKVKAITHQFDHTLFPYASLIVAHTKLLNCRQQPHETVDEYRENLRSWVEVYEAYGGRVAEIPLASALVTASDSGTLSSPRMTTNAQHRERTLATLMILNADRNRFLALQNELANAYARGTDDYPKDMTAAHNLLITYRNNHLPSSRAPNTSAQTTRTTPTNTTNTTPPATTSAPEAQAGTFVQNCVVPGSDGRTFDAITCNKCKRLGHYANFCPEANAATSAHILFQYAVNLAHYKFATIDPTWILLDSQSTISVFRNPDLLTNIRPSDHVLRAITNGGHQDSHLVGDFPNLGTVWYNPNSIANIISFADARRICRLTMDSTAEPAILLHRLDGSIMKFVEHECGLYVYDPNYVNDAVNPYSYSSSYSFLQTVAEQKKLFSTREVAAAKAARDLYCRIGRPSEAAEFQRILRGNLIRDCPITPDDARRALIIYGPDVAHLKGTTHRTSPAAHVPTFKAVPIPAPILEFHRDVTLCADFFFVQGYPFYHSISRGIGYRIVTPVPDRTKLTILKNTSTDIRVYQARGFIVRDMHCDHEFECIRDELLPISLDVVPPDSHVGEVERSIRTIKDRLRSAVHGLPFRRLPRLLVTELIAHVTRCLNMFPQQHGVSDTLSPATIVTGCGLPSFHALSLEFGAYVQVFEDDSPSNTLKARTLGAIALNPTGNANGDYFFLSLATGARISRHSWTELPIPDTAIARVEALALAEGCPLIQSSGLVVEWRPDVPIDDDIYDLDYNPPADSGDDISLDPFFTPVDPTELHDPLDPPLDVPSLPAQVQGAPLVQDPPEDNQIDRYIDPRAGEQEMVDGEMVSEYQEEPDRVEVVDDGRDQGAHEETHFDLDEGAHPVLDEGAHPGLDQGAHTGLDEGASPDDEPANPRTHPYHLRTRASNNTTANRRFIEAIDNPHSSRSYYPAPTQLAQYGVTSPPFRESECAITDTMRRLVFAHTMTQMSEKAGLKKHGQLAEAALLREFEQLEDLSVFTPMRAHELTIDQRKGALRAINLLKEKRDGTLKGRTVADGRPQRDLYEKGDTTSPTVSSDALITTIVIDAKEEGRDVATADVAGAYLKADMDEFVLLRFSGKAVDIMCEMDSKYKDYVTTEHGKGTLYMRLNKALYGCVRSALLWYNLFSETLVSFGFTLNPYDQCVANSDIEGSQCTIAWYVDDTKISHKKPAVVSRVIESIESHFGKMTVTRGSKHTFLSMNLTYNGNGTATIEMRDHLEEAIAYSGLDISRSVSTPALRYLFDVNKSSPKLSGSRADCFHRTTAKLLYVATRARMDILLPVCFLCTRVSGCTIEDEVKLRRVLEYLYGTMDLTYVVGADSLNKIHTWVDASYAVHPDMRSYTGGVISFGTGGLMCKSVKQKLNTKSSTEAELVGASDYMPNTIWMKMFLEAQGYRITHNVLEQDNESAIRLERNGRSSAGPRSRHIDIRYFFIQDRIKTERITIRHCPTTEMLADFFTKPLQGNLFYSLRAVIWGHKHVSELKKNTASPGEERVGVQGDRASSLYVENEVCDQMGHRQDVVDISRPVSEGNCFEGVHSLETIPL